MEAIIFDIWSDFAHFRRGYTTTSSLTYPFPPKTAIIGLIAGILGIPNKKREEKNYYKIFAPENLKIGIRLLNPVKTIMIKENLINTKESENPLYFKLGLISPEKGRTQIPIEFLKEPKYRIYAWFKNEKYEGIFEKFLKAHKSVYTPYLGITECVANFEFIGKYEIKKLELNENNEYEIDSVVPKNAGKVKVVENLTFGSIRMPTFINENREPLLFEDFIYIEEGNPMEIQKRIILTSIENQQKYIFGSVCEENVIFF